MVHIIRITYLDSFRHGCTNRSGKLRCRSEGLVNFDQSFFPNNLILKTEDCCPPERNPTQVAEMNGHWPLESTLTSAARSRNHLRHAAPSNPGTIDVRNRNSTFDRNPRICQEAPRGIASSVCSADSSTLWRRAAESDRRGWQPPSPPMRNRHFYH